MVKTRAWGLAACAGLVLLMTACGSAGNSAAGTGSAAAHAAKSPYQVGVMADLTGTAATLGQPEMAGIKFWADETNAAGGIDGHPISLVTCDSQSTAQGGVTCGSRLGSLPIVLATSLIGPDEAAMPSLTHSLVIATTPLLLPTKAAQPNAFQSQPTIAEADAGMLAAAQKNGIRTIGVIATDDATGTGAVKAMQGEAGKYGVSLAVQYVSSTTTSATVQVSQVVSAHAGMIFVASPGGVAAAVAQAYRSLGLRMPLVLTDADATDAFLQSIQSIGLTSLYAASALPIAPGAAPPASMAQPYRGQLAKVFAQYQRKTGKIMDLGPFQSYFTAQIVSDLLNGAGIGASLSTFEKFMTTHVLQTDIGPLRFDDPATNIVSGITPALVQMAPGKTTWQLCQSTSALKC